MKSVSRFHGGITHRAGTSRRCPLKAQFALICGYLLCFLILVFALAVELRAQEPAAEEGQGRFCAVDIFVDSGSTPLAAYQIQFAVTNRLGRIVGIEGGEHAAFRRPPFYDPKVIQNEIAI